VQLIQVDVVGAEPPQRRLDRVQDVLARHALVPRLRPHRADAFRRQHELVPLAAQPAADDLLRAAGRVVAATERIDVGGIEEVDATRRCRVQDGVALGLVALQAEGHRAQAQLRNLQAGLAEIGILHGGS
jgi:hypothetical protein